MDSDDNNPDAALHVRFQMISVYQTYDSTNPRLPDGKPNPRYTGSPVYKDIPHIQITTPGGLNGIVEEVRPEHRARFAKKWAMFEMAQGTGDQIVGTALAEWPAVTRSRAEELRAMKYYTVEQVANASDQQIQGIGMDGTMLRMKAQKFLEAARKTAVVEQQSEELAKKDAQIAELKANQERIDREMAELRSLAMGASKPQKRKGRPPKAKPEDVQQPAQVT